GFIGAALLAGRELELRGDAAGLIGAVAVVVAALSYAVGASYSRHRIQATHRYVVAAGTLVFAAIYMWLLALTADGLILPAEPDTLLAIAWLGLLGSFFAYVLYFFLIERLGATVATMVTYLFPLVAVTVGVTRLDEPFDARLLVGTALVVMGIVTVTLRYDSAVSRATSEARE
ncbi:MAG: DMT family transporter, partial [Candidatus Limnocylindria bacterium]